MVRKLPKLLFKLLIALLILAGCVAFVFVINLDGAISDAYAEWEAVGLVTNYMDTHNGSWPCGWNVLPARIGQGGSSVGYLQDRVFIDFNADVNDLRNQAVKSERVTFDVIHPRSIFAAHIGSDANAKLHYYFRSKAGIVESPEPLDTWATPEQRALANVWYVRGFFIRFDLQGNMSAVWTSLDAAVPGDAQISMLKDHPHIKRLNLVGVRASDASLMIIKHLPELEGLTISESYADACVDSLVKHPRLENLDIFGSGITDAGFRRLVDIPHLKSIRFDPHKISIEAVRDVLSAKPDLKIEG